MKSQGWDALLTAAPCRFVECDHVPLHPQVPLGPTLCHPAWAHLPHWGQHQEGPCVRPRGQHLAEGSGMRGWVQSPSWGGGAAVPSPPTPHNRTPAPAPPRCQHSLSLLPTHLLALLTPAELKMPQSFLPCSPVTPTLGAWLSHRLTDFKQRSHCRSPQDPLFPAPQIGRAHV